MFDRDALSVTGGDLEAEASKAPRGMMTPRKDNILDASNRLEGLPSISKCLVPILLSKPVVLRRHELQKEPSQPQSSNGAIDRK
jgi:hypothetical protein